MAREAWVRLLVAVLLSAAVHLSLMFGVAVRPPHPPPDLAWISARLTRPPALTPNPPPDRKTDRREVSPRPAADPMSVQASPPEPDAPRFEAVPYLSPPPADAPTPTAAGSTAALPPLDVPLITDPTWYQARQLDVFPRALSAVRPAYPEQGAQTAISGEVTLELLIDESGQVHAADVVRAIPEGHFEAAAVAAFQAARFSPGQKDGRPVRSRVVVKVVFSPEGAAHE